MGYVTRSQFRQCLSYLGLDSSEKETRVMETKFSDSKGFNYLHFLEELQPSEEPEDKYWLRMTQLTAKKQQVGNVLLRKLYSSWTELVLIYVALSEIQYYYILSTPELTAIGNNR